MVPMTVLQMLLVATATATFLLNAVRAEQTKSIDALLEVGRDKHLYLGIVCDDKKTLVKTFVAYSPGQSLDDVLAQIPDYESNTEGGVTIVRPHKLPTETARLLDTVIDEFTTGPATVSQMSLSLWMALQVKTAKTKPQAFWGVLHTSDQDVTKGLSLKNQTVLSILGSIARSKKDVSWVVLPPPPSIDGTPQNRLWGFLSYRSTPDDAPPHTLCCLDWQYLDPP